MDQKQLKYNSEKKERLDKYLTEQLSEYTRSQIQMWISEELVLVNQKKAKASLILKDGDIIEYTIPEIKESEITSQNIALDIIYEDSDIIVVNKPSGMVVHPASGNKTNTLVNALLYHCHDLSGINGVMRAGIVHRIDKDTSGLIVACKNDFAHKNLARQFAKREVTRQYTTLVHGIIPHNRGRIDAPIGRNPQKRQQMTVIETGKEAITNFTVLERFDEFTLLNANLETGRTHQIRVHMQYIGYPVVGDVVYGPRKVVGRHGQFLHASKLGFVHPRTKQTVEFNSPLPQYFEEFLINLRNQ